MTPRYPDITVRVTGTDGNVFHLLGQVNQAMRQAGVSQEERDIFFHEATAGNYDHVLHTISRWVDITSDHHETT